MNKTTPKEMDISKLLLDESNPRLGGKKGTNVSQRDILNSVVTNHGINDLLASISTNGFFDAEPLVCVQESQDEYVVVEGNRRLCACLILLKDKRAEDYKFMADTYSSDHVKSLNKLPIIVMESKSKLLSYLGARHIMGPKPWDSYAKATWLFEFITNTDSPVLVQDACNMIGDKSTSTIRKILEAYILTNQLKDESLFNPKDSLLKGRGSNLDYPFSWIYTSLGYQNIREWIGINGIEADDSLSTDTKVLDKPRSYDNAGKLLKFLFGSKSQGLNPSISESRDIKKLSEVVGDKIAVRSLEGGRPIADVWESLKPDEDRLFDLLHEISTKLGIVNEIIASSDLSNLSEKESIYKLLMKSSNLFKTVEKNLKDENE